MAPPFLGLLTLAFNDGNGDTANNSRATTNSVGSVVSVDGLDCANMDLFGPAYLPPIFPLLETKHDHVVGDGKKQGPVVCQPRA